MNTKQLLLASALLAVVLVPVWGMTQEETSGTTPAVTAADRLNAVLVRLSDAEKFEFWLAENRLALAFNNPEALTAARKALEDNQELTEAGRNFLLAMTDRRITEFAALSDEERKALIEEASVLQRQEDRLIARNSASDVNGRYSASGSYKIFACGRVERHHSASISGRMGGSVHSTYVLVVVDRSDTVLWAMRHQESRGHDSANIIGGRPSTRTWDTEAQMPCAVADSIRTENAVVRLFITVTLPQAHIRHNHNQLRAQLGQAALRSLDEYLRQHDL